MLALLGAETNVSAARISPEDIRAGKLKGFDVVMFTGGTGSGQARALGETGRGEVKKFVEQGGGQPVFEASVESKGSAKAERVIVSKQGDKYSAQREGEPSIYELDARSVEDLEKAATDVKEAAPEPKKKK